MGAYRSGAAEIVIYRHSASVQLALGLLAGAGVGPETATRQALYPIKSSLPGLYNRYLMHKVASSPSLKLAGIEKSIRSYNARSNCAEGLGGY
jgi:hypothetical protein